MREKLQEFWGSIEHWNVQSTKRLKYVPLPLGHRSALKRSQTGPEYLRYFLLRLLSNKSITRELVPSILRHRSAAGWMSVGLRFFLQCVKLECRDQGDVDLVFSCLTPRHPFIKHSSHGHDFEVRAEAFLDFVRVCQAKASGAWTMEQERARQTDRSRVRSADGAMLRRFTDLDTHSGEVPMARQGDGMG